MRNAVLYAINVILIVWGLLMCVMNITGVWNINWVLATLPLYIIPVFVLVTLFFSFLSRVLFGKIEKKEKSEKIGVKDESKTDTGVEE